MNLVDIPGVRELCVVEAILGISDDGFPIWNSVEHDRMVILRMPLWELHEGGFCEEHGIESKKLVSRVDTLIEAMRWLAGGKTPRPVQVH